MKWRRLSQSQVDAERFSEQGQIAGVRVPANSEHSGGQTVLTLGPQRIVEQADAARSDGPFFVFTKRHHPFLSRNERSINAVRFTLSVTLVVSDIFRPRGAVNQHLRSSKSGSCSVVLFTCARPFPGLVGAGKAVFLELVLCPPTTWSVFLVVLFTRARPFPGLVGAGKAVFLELVVLAAMIVVFHVLSSAVYPADLRDAFFVPYF